jgi:hypothetical protein
VSLVDGLLIYRAGAGNAVELSVNSTAAFCEITDNIQIIDSLSGDIPGNHTHSVRYDASSIKFIIIHLGDGNDSCRIRGNTVPVLVLGEQGRNTVHVGSEDVGLDQVTNLIDVVGTGSDQLIIDDAKGTRHSVYHISADTVFFTPQGLHRLTYNSVARLRLNTGKSAMGVHVSSTQETVTTLIDLRNSPNSVHVGVHHDNGPQFDIRGPLMFIAK